MLICQGGTRMSRHLDDKIRAECLTFMLNWQGPQLPDSARETVQLDAQDLVSRFSFYSLSLIKSPSECNLIYTSFSEKEHRFTLRCCFRSHKMCRGLTTSLLLIFYIPSVENLSFQLLVCKGANMTLENEAKESACDVAERFDFHEIAEYLETKMVFSVLCFLRLLSLSDYLSLFCSFHLRKLLTCVFQSLRYQYTAMRRGKNY